MTNEEQSLRSYLVNLPFVEPKKSRYSSSEAFYINNKEFVHFHGHGELDLRLTRASIRRLREAVGLRPNLHFRKQSSDWVVVDIARTSTTECIELILEAYFNNRGSCKGQLEDENAKLKKLLVEPMLDAAALRELPSKKR
jgi:hypothetical protein